MNTTDIKQRIHESTIEIERLRARIYETLAHRGDSQALREEWQRACSEFHARYDQLAFPGGYAGALERILSSDPLAIEATLCFLEMRPYFFRSGYMYKKLLRRIKRIPLSFEQSERLAAVLQRQAVWRAQGRVPRTKS